MARAISLTLRLVSVSNVQACVTRTSDKYFTLTIFDGDVRLGEYERSIGEQVERKKGEIARVARRGVQVVALEELAGDAKDRLLGVLHARVQVARDEEVVVGEGVPDSEEARERVEARRVVREDEPIVLGVVARAVHDEPVAHVAPEHVLLGNVDAEHVGAERASGARVADALFGNADLAAAKSSADAANAAAQSASSTASGAQSAANQALAAAQASQSCCDATNEKIDRMFRRSISK